MEVQKKMSSICDRVNNNNDLKIDLQSILNISARMYSVSGTGEISPDEVEEIAELARSITVWVQELQVDIRQNRRYQKEDKEDTAS